VSIDDGRDNLAPKGKHTGGPICVRDSWLVSEEWDG
jgi:hypothetical protein